MENQGEGFLIELISRGSGNMTTDEGIRVVPKEVSQFDKFTRPELKKNGIAI